MTEQEQEAMRTVLGCIIQNQAVAPIALAALRDDAMTGKEYVILRSIRHLAAAENKIDAMLVESELATAGDLEIAGGREFVSRLCDYSCAPTNVEVFCKIVNREALRRKLKDACLAALEALEDPTTDPEVALDGTEHRIMAIRDNAKQGGPELAAFVIERALQGQEHGIPTGYRLFDWATGGMSSHQLITIGARPGVGKTALSVCIADHVARQGKPVLYFSLEMAPREIGQRLIAIQGVPLADVKAGGPNVTEAAITASMVKIWIEHMTRPTLMDLRASIRRLKEKPALVVVDYLQLVSPGKECNSRSETIDAVATGLKWIAGEFEIPVLALAQLNRNNEQNGKPRRPVLSDLRESGGIEQASDVVAFLHRAEYYDPANRDAELIVAKNRQGPMAACKLEFAGEFARFDNIDRPGWGQ